MKAALIFTPNQLNPNYREIAFRDDHIGFIPPLSLLYIAALMEREGVEVIIIDMAAEQLGYEQALARLREFSPDLLGFSITTMSFHPVLSWIGRFKQDTGIQTLVGGEHVGLYPHETMAHDAIDFCIVGEAEIPLPEFIRAYESKSGFDGIKSVGYRKNGEVIIDCTHQAVDSIDDIPLPARHLIRNELYENILTRKKNFTAMISSRGCPFNCAFCNENHQKYRARSAVKFVDEIEYNLKTFDIRDFDIYDSTFTADKARVNDICGEVTRRGLKVSFSIRSRVDSVSPDMISNLKSAGCHTIMFGIESSSPEILRIMNKAITPDQVMEVIGYTHRAGIKTLGFFLFGFPGETRKTIEDTISFSVRLPLDYAQFTVLLPLPDTEIYSYYRERGLGDYWAEYTLDSGKADLIELIDTGITREEMTKYILAAYRRFYLRPRVIMRRLMGLASFNEFSRMAKGAVALLLSRSR
jgi:radical SAM superfamily enzyme YgiQ (UPF0313 family)